jgi:serine/threonine-protein kinase 11
MLVGCLTNLPLVTPISHETSHPRRIRKLNNYLLREKIGSGNSCTVYRAVEQCTNQTFAVKRIKLYELVRAGNGVSQLEREIRLMRLFHHPNILRLIEVLHVRCDDEVYLVLEYADCGSVGALIDRGEDLDRASVFSILKQVVTAIKYLHDLSYVHQDIKPWNILLDSTGRAILGDFGVGHSFESASMVVGTPAYQAPECLDDSYICDDDSAADAPQKEDIWALGVTLYQLLFKRLPFAGASLYEIVNTIKEQPLEIPDGTDLAVERLLRGMLTVDPVNRFGIDDVIKHPLVVAAADRAGDLPGMPLPALPRGIVTELVGEVCTEGCSFVDLASARSRRFSYAAYDVHAALSRPPGVRAIKAASTAGEWAGEPTACEASNIGASSLTAGVKTEKMNRSQEGPDRSPRRENSRLLGEGVILLRVLAC